jgi:rubrerythrin
MLSEDILKRVLISQKAEITEHNIYRKLARATKDTHNRELLLSISNDELRHYRIWAKYTGKEVKPAMIKVWFYYIVSRIFGITFGIKLMEKGEGQAQINYAR